MFAHHPERRGPSIPAIAKETNLWLLNTPRSLAGDDDENRGQDETGRDKSVPGDDSERGKLRKVRKEKTISEAFEDLSADEKETVNRLLDRITGRKK
ncbi:hypothetical protein [Roseibium alexandrii]|uniref:hypothetical protein n=1 Tax=Roseibium alexandrii TaxID=388408 RepID=UPI0037524DB9